MKAKIIISYVFVLASFVISWFAWKNFPDIYATHWNQNGIADGFSHKGIGLFGFPLLQLALILLLQWVPKLDPKKENIKKFSGVYGMFILAFSGFITYLQVLMYMWNTGFTWNMTYAMIPGMAFFFWVIGDMVGQTKMNYMIGIRTPWTLSSETVWDKTHQLGGKLIKGGALVSLLGLVVPDYGFYLFLGAILLPMMYLFWYSYKEFKNSSSK